MISREAKKKERKKRVSKPGFVVVCWGRNSRCFWMVLVEPWIETQVASAMMLRRPSENGGASIGERKRKVVSLNIVVVVVQ